MTPTSRTLVIAGGGIGGLAAALAAAQAGWSARVYEQAPAFEDIGAGLQLGPNASRVLVRWGLSAALQQVAAQPDALVVRSAATGACLGRMRLGRAFARRYGAPYFTLHRADLHAALLAAAQRSGAKLTLNAAVRAYFDAPASVRVHSAHDPPQQAALLVGADGLHSTVRHHLLGDGGAWFSGDIAWRSLLSTERIPANLRTNQVTVWLAPGLHVVHYPVRQGTAMNLVVLTAAQGQVVQADADNATQHGAVLRALAQSCAPLQALISAVPQASLQEKAWRLWPIMVRQPLRAAAQMAQGRVALLGDAAHPMHPYLAQGAAMAIEDAAALAQALRQQTDVLAALQHYAARRWRRCAQVQKRSARNGRIFHAAGVVRRGRNLSLRLLGRWVMDLPWLYGFGR